MFSDVTKHIRFVGKLDWMKVVPAFLDKRHLLQLHKEQINFQQISYIFIG